MPVKIFIRSGLRAQLGELFSAQLIEDFKSYKEQKLLPSSFGRDVSYRRPHGALVAELNHLHLSEQGQWPLRMLQYNRTSDKHLVYCPGFDNPDYFALIAILEPLAHDQANDIDIMLGLSRYAEAFRQQY